MLIAPLLAWTALSAQTLPVPVPPVQEQLSTDGRHNQRVERIRIEDSGVVVDEVRYAGQTQSIVVQPKADVPEYEIQPTDLARSRPADHRDGMGNATGQRVWNLFKF